MQSISSPEQKPHGSILKIRPRAFTYRPTYIPIYIYLSTGSDSQIGRQSISGTVGPWFESLPCHAKGIENGTSSSLAYTCI